MNKEADGIRNEIVEILADLGVVGAFNQIDFDSITEEQRKRIADVLSKDTDERLLFRNIMFDQVCFDNLTPEQREDVCTWLDKEDIEWLLYVSCNPTQGQLQAGLCVIAAVPQKRQG